MIEKGKYGVVRDYNHADYMFYITDSFVIYYAYVLGGAYDFADDKLTEICWSDIFPYSELYFVREFTEEEKVWISEALILKPNLLRRGGPC